MLLLGECSILDLSFFNKLYIRITGEIRRTLPILMTTAV